MLHCCTTSQISRQSRCSLCRPCDTCVLQGFTLEKLIAERSQLDDDSERVVAQVRVWRDHSHLLQIVSELISPAGLQ